MNKKQIIATTAIVAGLGLAGAYGIQTASAATDTNSFPPMIKQMVERFNLNTDEVSKLVEENRETRQGDRKADFEARLTEAVTAGKITEEQKAAIIAKHDELDAKRDAIRSEGQEDRENMHTQMQAIRTEMLDFLKSQGIDESVLPTPKGPKGGMGGGMGMHRGLNR